MKWVKTDLIGPKLDPQQDTRRSWISHISFASSCGWPLTLATLVWRFRDTERKILPFITDEITQLYVHIACLCTILFLPPEFSPVCLNVPDVHQWVIILWVSTLPGFLLLSRKCSRCPLPLSSLFSSLKKKTNIEQKGLWMFKSFL